MLHVLFKKLRQVFRRKEKPPEKEEEADAQILITLDDQGDFTVATHINKTNEEMSEVTGMVLHMINSGLMADIFLQSLNLWAETEEQKIFILKVIESWKGLYDEDPNQSSKSSTKKLAVDPSDVFGLKNIKG